MVDDLFLSDYGMVIFIFVLVFLCWYCLWFGLFLMVLVVVIVWLCVYFGVYWLLDMFGGLLVGMIGCFSV